MDPMYAVVPVGTESYWGGWWERIADDRVGKMVMIRSRRSGQDARLDAEVLIGRLSSGLHWSARVFKSKTDAEVMMGIART